MNFFYNQDQARSKTRLLIFGFVLSVIIIIALIDLAIIAVVSESDQSLYKSLRDPEFIQYIYLINLGIFSVILLGSLYSYFKFRSGGQAIVNMLNATRIDYNSSDPKKQKLINVVQEMSIAAGIAAPPLYILEGEDGINAFVAGHNPSDVVLVVTQGSLDNLNRDELQGVIAHEYSHIFNGDTALNLRLMIVLSGLLVLSQVGNVLMRTRSTRDKKNQTAIIGIILFIFGYIGFFFGSILKAAISRQKECLADASAVQYTRNSNGLARALLKIEQQGRNALLVNDHAEEINHMCFSRAQISGLFDIFATHPKIEQRIEILDPTGEIRAEFMRVYANKNPKR